MHDDLKTKRLSFVTNTKLKATNIIIYKLTRSIKLYRENFWYAALSSETQDQIQLGAM